MDTLFSSGFIDKVHVFKILHVADSVSVERPLTNSYYSVGLATSSQSTQVLWGVTPCRGVTDYRRFERLDYLIGDDQSCWKHYDPSNRPEPPSSDRASHPRKRLEASACFFHSFDTPHRQSFRGKCWYLIGPKYELEWESIRMKCTS